MPNNPGGLVDRWYPVMDVTPHNGSPVRFIWTDAVEAYLSNLPAPHQGLAGWRMDQDRTICDECVGCLPFSQAPGAVRYSTVLSTNFSHATEGTFGSAFRYGTTLIGSHTGDFATNIAGAAGWLPNRPFSGWVGTAVPAVDVPGASRTESADNYYSQSFTVPTAAAYGSLTYEVTAADSVVEILINGELVDAPVANGPTALVTGQVGFVPLVGTNWLTVKIRENTPGAASAHGWMGYFTARSVADTPFTNPIEDDMWWTVPGESTEWSSTARPETGELLGFRIWPGTEIVVRQSFSSQGGSDRNAGNVMAGKATLTATVQVVSTTARGSQYGIDLLLQTLTNSCTCGACGDGVDVSLYAGCDPDADAEPGEDNLTRRTLRGAKLTGWQDMELTPPMPSHNGRLITITMEATDGRLWVDSEVVTSLVAPSTLPQMTGITTNGLPGPHYDKTYTYLKDRTAWPVQFNNDGTATPVGNWSTLNNLQVLLGASNLGTGFIYADSYYRVDGSTHPVRLVYDRVEAIFYYETIGWTWPTGVTLPCDFDVEITEFAQRNVDDSGFETKPNPSADCTLWVQPGAPNALVGVDATIPAQGANASRGPLVAVGPYAGTYVWTVDPTLDPTIAKQIDLGCHFGWYRPLSQCPPSIDTNPAVSGLPVTVTVAANGQMTWAPTGGSWTYSGGTFPPQNRSFIISVQIVDPIVSTVTVISDEPACDNGYLCYAPVPPLRPDIPWESACEGGITNTPGATLHMGYVDMLVPRERCATINLELKAATAAVGNLSVMVFDITDLAPGFTLDQLWLQGYISVADLHISEGDNKITILDGVQDQASMICGTSEPPVDFEPWGSHGIWIPPCMAGGRKYRLGFISVGGTGPQAAYLVTTTVATYSRG